MSQPICEFIIELKTYQIKNIHLKISKE